MAALMAIRRPDGLSTLEASRLARWETGLVTVRHCAIQNAHWRPGLALGEPSRILLPELMQRWDQRRRLMHELAHPLLDVGLSVVADGMTMEEKHAFRQARRAEKHEEQLADDLVVALRLPSHVAARFGEVRELSSLSGLPWSVVQRRVNGLKAQVFHLHYLPYWCAARTLRLEHVPAAEEHFRILDGDAPVIRVLADHGNRTARGIRLRADLAALRKCEFLQKYNRFRTAVSAVRNWRAKPCRIDMEELHTWAREGIKDDLTEC